MHEFAITEQLLQIALEAAAGADAHQIAAVHVAVGSLTGVTESSMRFYFEALTPGTPAAGARLVVHIRPALATCASCGHTFAVAPPVAGACPACAACALEISGGRELMVTHIEIDEPFTSPLHMREPTQRITP